MSLPIYAYGQPVLKKKALPIDQSYEGLDTLIDQMWETMYEAHGVGLAAPQIGMPIRLFVIDTIQLQKENEPETGIKQVFINAELIDENGKLWTYEEGCLSIPNIRGDVERLDTLQLQYLDQNFNKHTAVFDGINARVIQHEYDHIEGILFVERLKPLKKTLIRKKLEKIKLGQTEVDYRIKFFGNK